MGSFYTSFVLKGASAEAAQRALAGRKTVVARDKSGFIVVFDEEAEDQNDKLLDDLAAFLSQELQCVVIAFLNHDDSILIYTLYDQGLRKDSYNSNPGYFGDADQDDEEEGGGEDDDPHPLEPPGGHAATLCAVLPCPSADQSALERILTASSGDEYVFESERHADLARVLGLPEQLVGFGYTQIASGEMPDEPEGIELLWSKDVAPNADARPGYYKVVVPHPTPGEEPISMPVGWLPATWEKMRAAESDVSERSRRATAAIRESMEALGFKPIAFHKFVDVLNPNLVDGAGAFYVDEARQIFGQIIYHIYAGASGEIESMVCLFRATFPNETLVCSNQKPSPLASPPNFTIVREDTPDPLVIFNRFMEEFRTRSEAPEKFATEELIGTQFDLEAKIVLEERVRKGQYVLMNPFEVWRAKQVRAHCGPRT